jgi:hypothetical protein
MTRRNDETLTPPAYEPPRVTPLGSVSELTQANLGGSADGQGSLGGAGFSSVRS